MKNGVVILLRNWVVILNWNQVLTLNWNWVVNITGICNNPHISVGRKLKPENLEIAKHLFTTINTSFLCDTIVLREHNPIIKQFFITNTFTFNNNPQPDFIQGKLF